ncbi:MAG: glycosyltransferase family 4 protein [Eubacterium sp.]|nr:glycosyltransferase family 4 protein [Eubacterium sp.]
MNIVHLQNLGGIGGIAVLTRDIAKFSKENNFFYFVYEGGDIAEQIKEYAPVYVAEESRKKLTGAAKHFYAYCKENNIDVIVEHTGTAIGLTCALYAQKKLGAGLIIYWHAVAGEIKTDSFKKRIEVMLKRRAYKRCSHAAAISKCVKDSYLKAYGYKEDKVAVVYNGINCDKFFSERLGKEGALPFNIIYVGRVFRPKGIHVLINAVNLLDDEIKSNIRIKIVGQDRGTYTEEMIEKSEKLGLGGIIEFTGARLDVPELLSQADLFIHPAICEEGFGITLAEAMASYLPCIAFRRGAIPEVIDDAKNGFIVSKVSSESLAKAIESTYKTFKDEPEKYALLRKNARAKAQTFSIENTLKTLEELYGN